MKIIYFMFFLLSCTPYKVPTEFTRKVRINQIGYFLTAKKVAVIAGVEKVQFKLVDRERGDIVLTSYSSEFYNDSWASEKISYADFSGVTRVGHYNLVVEGIGVSPSFVISENPYNKLHRALLKGFYYQRASEDLDQRFAGEWKRKGLKTTYCKIWNSDIKKECSGGWFDAGDYGRYSVTTAVAAAILLNSYKLFPDHFGDDLGIPESKNGIPDILDEAKVGLSFLLKMQDSDGGVFHKATSKKFNYIFVPPHRAFKNIYLMPKSVTATFDFAAVMAMASKVYKSEEFKEAAERAWKWAFKNRKRKGFQNPDGVKTGEYGDDNNADELLWAAVELYRVSKEKKYFDIVKKFSSKTYNRGFGWRAVGTFARLSAQDDKELERFFSKNELKNKNSYGLFSNAHSFTWGSNGNFLRDASELIVNKKFSKNEVQPVLDYILGRNPLGQSFITGFGEFQVENPHHRQSVSDLSKRPVPGLLVGGANKNLDGIYAQDYLKDFPISKRYLDHMGSYSTNETSIDINAAALFFVSSF